MLAIGFVLNTLGIGLWAIFALAVYALPFFVALSIGMTAFQGGAGLIGALLLGTAGGALTLVLGQIAFAVTRSLTLRIAIATAFAVPAAVAGYHILFAVSHIGVPSLAWREVFACLGAACIGVTSWTRLMALAETRPFEPGRVGCAQESPDHFEVVAFSACIRKVGRYLGTVVRDHL
ncbi:hypothetical protein GGD67_003665 [Bradyrhizobium sp. IAR9]|uniref:hypothetical protein n=1 Tax=Bradyrhizobium sp. IAR9 TaxID=2663841 RepID=UPI0018118E29|nr:hypothetical protein [Bradyrhizobium sp. IAR9]NYG46194.1 hypothetical protein [Bradyrhizobium sp. IAR9]